MEIFSWYDEVEHEHKVDFAGSTCWENKMKTVTVLEFRKNAKKIIQWVTEGQRLMMTYRGKPVARIEPLEDNNPDANDPFYLLAQQAVEEGIDLSNEDMDRILYDE